MIHIIPQCELPKWLESWLKIKGEEEEEKTIKSVHNMQTDYRSIFSRLAWFKMRGWLWTKTKQTRNENTEWIQTHTHTHTKWIWSNKTRFCGLLFHCNYTERDRDWWLLYEHRLSSLWNRALNMNNNLS